MKRYRREYYYRNREREIARVRKNNKKYLSELRQWFAEYKKTLKCSKCDESDPVCLDFHHRDSTTKDCEVSKMVASQRSKDSILAEVQKCDVLCSNCHRKYHAKK